MEDEYINNEFDEKIDPEYFDIEKSENVINDENN